MKVFKKQRKMVNGKIRDYILEITRNLVLLNDAQVERIKSICQAETNWGKVQLSRYDLNRGEWVAIRTSYAPDEALKGITVGSIPEPIYFFYRHDLTLSTGECIGSYYTTRNSLFD